MSIPKNTFLFFNHRKHREHGDNYFDQCFDRLKNRKQQNFLKKERFLLTSCIVFDNI
jgi:hypothetical protein